MTNERYEKDMRYEIEDVVEQNKYVLARIVYYIDKICQEHDLNYSLGFGTLLGAVREKDIIGWDLDADIYMDSKSYIKFLEIAPKELPSELYLQHNTTDPLFCSNSTFCRIVDLKSSIVPISNQRMSPNGLHSDIQCVNDDSLLYEKLLRKDGTISFLKKIGNNTIYPLAFLFTSFDVRKTFAQMLGYGYYLAFETCFIYKNKELKKNRQECNKDPYKILDNVYVDFRDFKVKIPKTYDKLLKDNYGDYLIPPKQEEIESDLKKIRPREKFNKKDNVILRYLYENKKVNH